uniref:Uncharacterized protein n=1 Tax=Malurus cyaneus samueli TaxID=2593467 RepID=A0A8C5U4L7_9PASS
MILLLRSSWHSGELLSGRVVQRKLASKLHPEKYLENREVAEKKSEKSPEHTNLTWCQKRSNGDNYTKCLNSEYIFAHSYTDVFEESVFYSVKVLVVTSNSGNHRKSCGRRRERNRCFFPILGVSPIPGTGFTSFGSYQAGGCSSSIASLNSSRKGNIRSVIAMSKILTGVKIPTERIVTNGKERIETGRRELRDVDSFSSILKGFEME